MKHLILALLMAISIPSFAQNGGQYPENNSVKLEYLGGGKVKVTNKQSCTSIIRLNDGKTEGDISIPGNSFVLYILPAELQTNIRIRAKNTSNCNCPDFGYVELFLSSLPVIFTDFKVTKESGTNVRVNFNIENPVNVGKFYIMTSKDGKTWIKSDSLSYTPASKTYSTIINISVKKQ